MKWTIKTLKKYFDLKFESDRCALKLSRRLMNKRLEGMNNIHQQLVKQNETFVSKDELALRDQKIEALQRLVYIGLGVWLILQPIIIYIINIIVKK